MTTAILKGKLLIRELTYSFRALVHARLGQEHGGKHSAGAVMRALHPHPQVGWGMGLEWAFEISKPTPMTLFL